LTWKGDFLIRKTLENLYYGNITPGEQQFYRNTDYDKAMKTVSGCEEKLMHLLNDDEKELLADMVSAQHVVNGVAAAENFIMGFRLGMRIGIEVMDDDDGCVGDI